MRNEFAVLLLGSTLVVALPVLNTCGFSLRFDQSIRFVFPVLMVLIPSSPLLLNHSSRRLAEDACNAEFLFWALNEVSQAIKNRALLALTSATCLILSVSAGFDKFLRAGFLALVFRGRRSRKSSLG